ncbi:MAG: glycosyltransferase family 2 protein [Lachnospiraceae bacterium]|nr:glycosyltransferase family 2 protein [Lachnospiraceae bacterium]
MDALVSVIVPVYNSTAYLERCVDAILSQTYKNLEVILVDDGSKDDSLSMCRAYEEKDSRVKCIHKENGGSSSARNVGIKEAKGEYICFCDSDDYYEPDIVENLSKVFDENEDAMIAQCMAVCRNEDGTLESGPLKDSGKIVKETSEEYLRELLLHLGDSSFCTKMIKADFMKRFSFNEGRLNEDFELLVYMQEEIDNIYTYEITGYNIILRFGSNTRNVYKNLFYDCMIENSDMVAKLVDEKHPSLKEEARKFQLYQRLDYTLHTPLSKMKNNPMADKVLRELKEWRKDIDTNSYLAPKDRRNLKILSRAPKFSKWVHNKIMFIKGKPVEK